MRVAERIKAELSAAFDPARLDLVDQSALHKGHSGARPQGESHFKLMIVSNLFEGKSRIERQRLIYSALGDMMTTEIHALSISALTPTEADNP
jgi:BolA protein